jgi:hypothetical protein
MYRTSRERSINRKNLSSVDEQNGSEKGLNVAMAKSLERPELRLAWFVELMKRTDSSGLISQWNKRVVVGKEL